MKPIYKATYIKVSQCGLGLKVRYRDIICLELNVNIGMILVGEIGVNQGRRVVMGLEKLF